MYVVYYTLYCDFYHSIAGLFHQAILQSGSPTSFWSVYNSTVPHEHFVRTVANMMGCTQPHLHDQIECLRVLPQQKFKKFHWKVLFRWSWFLCGHVLKHHLSVMKGYREYGVCHSSLLTTGQECHRILTQMTYLALFSQPIYFVNAYFLLATDYYISSWSSNLLQCSFIESYFWNLCISIYIFISFFVNYNSFVLPKHLAVYPCVCGHVLSHNATLLY